MTDQAPENAELDAEGNVVYSDGPAKAPLNPKVIAGAVWGFAAPVLLAVVFALIGYFGTDEGKALTAGWPVVLQIAFFGAVAGISAGLAGYRQSDAGYRRERAQLGV